MTMESKSHGFPSTSDQPGLQHSAPAGTTGRNLNRERAGICATTAEVSRVDRLPCAGPAHGWAESVAWHGASDDCSGIVGNSRPLADCLRLMLAAATTNASVLICGEPGTGKELFARAIHANSARVHGNFVTIDCSLLPEFIVGNHSLAHEKGLFYETAQVFEDMLLKAHCGTLFLDDVGELSADLQRVFLWLLEEHRFLPAFSQAQADIDFRLVAATSRDLRHRVAHGRFCKDLLDRLQEHSIDLPPLRDRSEDIHALADYHLVRLCRRYGLCPKQLTPEFVRTLSLYAWPGNIAELINALEQALFTAHQECTLFPKHLPQNIRIQVAKSALKSRCRSQSKPSLGQTEHGLPRLQDFRSEIFSQAEQQYLANLMQHTDRNLHQACQLSGLSRSQLYSLLKKHQIPRH